MAKRKTKEESAALDVPTLRAETLGGFLRLAKHTLEKKPELRSITLTCSQFYADEAGDAVHESLVASNALLPTAADAADEDERVGWDTVRTFMYWDSNSGAVYGFAPLCNEEGWSEGGRGEEADADEDADFDEMDFMEGGSPTALAMVQKLDDGTLRASWLGALHRPWLDFPGAMKDRDDMGDEAPEFADDPPAPALQGKEKDLYAQVFADPTDLGVREVLRDLWNQRDDARGEFSGLSTAPEQTEEVRARAAELVLAHGRSWLGPLQKAIPFAGALFGPGPFVRKAIVHADAKTFKKVADAAEWGTVEEIVFSNKSARLLTPAMKNLRVVGPLGPKDLGPLREGTWRVEEIDYEASGPAALDALAKLALPLKRLRLRAEKAPQLAGLQKASWWNGLERLELWLPGSTTDGAGVASASFAALAAAVPATCEVAVGQLTGGQRSGWMVAGKAQQRRMQLLRPDARTEQGREWAKMLSLALPDTWDAKDDEQWMVYGLGVSFDTGAA